MFNTLEKDNPDQMDCSNPQDFKKLYDATFSLLFKVSFRIVEDEECAEDLVHDSFIKANEKKMVFPSLDDGKFWLIRVVHNASLNYIKRKGREANAYHKAFYEKPQTTESSEKELLKADSSERVKKALAELPEKYREVIVLKEYSEMNYKEIGEALGISEGNVKVRVFRAREQLIKLLGGDDVYVP